MQSNSNNESRIDRIEAALERFIEETNRRSEESDRRHDDTNKLIQSNAKSIEAILNDRRQLEARQDRTDNQIAQLTRNMAVMFEVVQELSKDRVALAENMASIARSLAILAGEQAE